ncbi:MULTISPECIES: hypothetical protein [unclassified Pseudomonas]|uniref:hypothetical protein n=1 Tax=unclassified Pseudomonas TaxID=196821 RepID=UPI000BA4D7C3|nr:MULTISPECIES: hypothetical protein [unclassified Pseudomonas]
MSNRKPHNMRVRVERSCRALLRSNHLAVVNIDPSGQQWMINWKNRRIIRSRQIVDAIFDVPHRWTIYISGMCIDQAGGEYLKSVEIAPEGMYLASQLADAIEHYYTEVRDSCNPQHLIAYGWIAIPSAVSLDEEQAAKVFAAVGVWNQQIAA